MQLTAVWGTSVTVGHITQCYYFHDTTDCSTVA